jgi:hypothetical protein
MTDVSGMDAYAIAAERQAPAQPRSSGNQLRVLRSRLLRFADP